jgi:hypothetical protein
MSHPWPELDLTDYERKFVSYYKHYDNKTQTMKPGVLKRVYKVVLNDVAVGTSNDFNAVHTIGSVQIARRTRVFGLRFIGDVDSYLVNIRTATGESYTNGPCLVSALCPGTLYNIQANIGTPPTPATQVYHHGMSTLIIEPNWELQPNQTLLFEGSLPADVTTKFLKIGIHVWEFPGMELAAGGA